MNLICAGDLQVLWDKTTLRYISVSGVEVIRMIYPALRIEGWLTVEPEIVKTESEFYDRSFRITVQCRYQSEGVDFEAIYKISGSPDNTLCFEMEGTALTAFKKNRIGFCVLHPIGNTRGQKCTIVHSNGDVNESTFPYYISPHQPFKDIAEMHWQIPGCISAGLYFTGDIFEMEDQRNWTDNSYKTYCTPLDAPYPVWMEKGEKIFQKVELKVKLEQSISPLAGDSVYIDVYPEQKIQFPKIGIGRSSRAEPILDEEIDIIKKIPFDHYRVDLYLFENNWADTANFACNEAEKLGFLVEFALFFDSHAEQQLSRFITWMELARPKVAMIHLFDKELQATPGFLLQTIVTALRDRFPGIRIGAGTNANFAQLNRTEINTDSIDYLTFSIHPQEHAFDDLSLIENMEAQKYTVESLGHRYGKKDLVISPVTLRRRFNANIENFERASDNSLLPSQVDPRQLSIFAALWTLGSLKYLSEQGSSGITYYETIGERGLFQGSFPTRWPGEFRSFPGMIFPVYHLLRFILHRKDAQIIRSRSSDPLSAEVLVLNTMNGQVFIIANFRNCATNIHFKNLKSETIHTHIDNSNYFLSTLNSGWMDRIPGKKIRLDKPVTLTPCSLNFFCCQ